MTNTITPKPQHLTPNHVSRFTFHVSRDTLVILGVALVAILVWVGQGREADVYLEGIKERGVLRVGVDPTYPPFATVRDGKVEGYEAELAELIAADLGVRVEFVPLALDSLYDALAAENVDMLISSLPFIYERQREVRYSQPYYDAGQTLVVRRGNTRMKDAADLAGKKVGVELGSAADTEVRRLSRAGAYRLELVTFDTPQEALDALVKNEQDAVATDNTSAHAYAQTHPGSIAILSPLLTSEPYVIAMPAGATSLAAQVDATIIRLRASGELARMMGLGEE